MRGPRGGTHVVVADGTHARDGDEFPRVYIAACEVHETTRHVAAATMSTLHIQH